MGENQNNNVLDRISLKDFTLQRILFNNAAKKSAGLLGIFTNSETDQGIIIVEKVEFTEDNFVADNDADLILKHILLKTNEINDVYGNFFGETCSELSSKLGSKFSLKFIVLTTFLRIIQVLPDIIF